MTDAWLVALLLSRFVFKVPPASMGWNLLKENRAGLSSYTQAYPRSVRLLARLEALATTAERLAEVIIESMPLPVYWPKRPRRCRFPGARWGYGPQGGFYGYRLPAWGTATGKGVQDVLRPAHLHAVTGADEWNRHWAACGGPQVTGDRGHAALGFVFPPKKNTADDAGWREPHHPKLRKRMETVFSQQVAAQIRSVQAKTLPGLRLRVGLAVLAHDLGRP